MQSSNERRSIQKFNKLSPSQRQEVLNFHRSLTSKQAVSNYFRRTYGLKFNSSDVGVFFKLMGLDMTNWNAKIATKNMVQYRAKDQGVEVAPELRSVVEAAFNEV
jgi:hypothetical protein